MCEGQVGRVSALHRHRSEAEVAEGSVVRTASTVVIDLDGGRIEVGDWVVVHLGFVVEVLDPAEAERVVAHREEVRAAARADEQRGGHP